MENQLNLPKEIPIKYLQPDELSDNSYESSDSNNSLNIDNLNKLSENYKEIERKRQSWRSQRLSNRTCIFVKEKIIKLAAGTNNYLFLTQTGKVYTMGSNLNENDELTGKLGIYDYFATQPTLIELNAHIIEFSTNDNHSLFVDNKGFIYSCGKNDFGQLGRGTIRESYFFCEKIDLDDFIVNVSAGLNHSLVLTAFNTVYSFGDNSFGQLGRSVINKDETFDMYPNVINVDNIKKISAGDNHSLILQNTGLSYSFGSNEFGQLGRFCFSPIHEIRPIYIDDVKDISAGENHSLLISNGMVYTFGSNKYNQLGRSTKVLNRPHPLDYHNRVTSKTNSSNTLNKNLIFESAKSLSSNHLEVKKFNSIYAGKNMSIFLMDGVPHYTGIGMNVITNIIKNYLSDLVAFDLSNIVQVGLSLESFIFLDISGKVHIAYPNTLFQLTPYKTDISYINFKLDSVVLKRRQLNSSTEEENDSN